MLDEKSIKEYWEKDVAGVLSKVAVDQLQDADPDKPSALLGPYKPGVESVPEFAPTRLMSVQPPSFPLLPPFHTF